MLRPFAHPVVCCWMLLRVVAQSLKPVKLFSHQFPTFLLLRDRQSVAQQYWIRLHSSSNIVGATHAHYAWFPTMHCRSQHCWELLHPFAHYCQHARNNSQHCWRDNVRSCCVRLHAALSDSAFYGQLTFYTPFWDKDWIKPKLAILKSKEILLKNIKFSPLLLSSMKTLRYVPQHRHNMHFYS